MSNKLSSVRRKMFGPSARVIKVAKEKSQKFFASESERFTYKIDRILTVYQGYNRIKPKLFPKRLSTMYSVDVVPTEDDSNSKREHYFHSSTLVGTSSLRRHQRERGLYEGQIDTSSKIRIVLPAAAAQTTYLAAGGGGEVDYGRSVVMAPRTRRSAGPKTPTKVIMTTPKRGGEGNILCSSVMLTYREGLFHREKDMVRNESDV